EAFDILEENRDVLDALVTALMEQETLDKGEVAAIFEPLRRRPRRPAWTGSPEREPSPIPPVDVPKSAGNGAPEQPESGVILTPPGSGGDVHGDPTV
ncbi:MAG: ATP-dependent zinc metalloprotease FtsH, partial [Nocardioidaceae bacterium]